MLLSEAVCRLIGRLASPAGVKFTAPRALRAAVVSTSVELLFASNVSVGPVTDSRFGTLTLCGLPAGTVAGALAGVTVCRPTAWPSSTAGVTTSWATREPVLLATAAIWPALTV